MFEKFVRFDGTRRRHVADIPGNESHIPGVWGYGKKFQVVKVHEECHQVHISLPQRP